MYPHAHAHRYTCTLTGAHTEAHASPQRLGWGGPWEPPPCASPGILLVCLSGCSVLAQGDPEEE